MFYHAPPAGVTDFSHAIGLHNHTKVPPVRWSIQRQAMPLERKLWNPVRLIGQPADDFFHLVKYLARFDQFSHGIVIGKIDPFDRFNGTVVNLQILDVE